MAKRLFVAGGSGFIGKAICELAVASGCRVVALARSGPPDVNEGWADHVQWVAADVFEPETWRDHLSGCDAVVHAIGTAQEDPAQGATFMRLNGESALLLAREAATANVEAFVMISAQTKPPFVSERYLAAKRMAEDQIPERHPSLRAAFLRPALVYGAERPSSVLLGRAIEGLDALPVASAGLHESRALPVGEVAAAAVHAAVTPGIRGILGIDDIRRIAQGPSSPLRAVAQAPGASSVPAAAVAAGTAAAGFVLRTLLRRS